MLFLLVPHNALGVHAERLLRKPIPLGMQTAFHAQTPINQQKMGKCIEKQLK